MTTSIEKLQAENTMLKQRIAELEQERIAAPAASADSASQSPRAAFQADELELFRTILESSPDNILIWDEQYNYLYANQAAIDQVGTTRDKVIGKNIRDGLGHIPDFMHLWMGRIDHVIATGETIHREESMQMGDIIATGIYTMFPVRDKAGRVYAMGLIYRDITEQKQVLEEQRRLVALIENSTDFIGISSLEGHAQYVNQAGCAMMGLDDLEAVHQTNVPEYYVPEDRVWIERDVLPQVFSTGIWSGEVRFKNFATGELIPVHHTLFLIRDQDRNEPIAVGTISRDITEQKRQEDELRLFKAMADTAPDGVALTRLDTGQIFYANSTYRAMFGYGDDIIGVAMGDVHADSPERMAQLMEESIEQGVVRAEVGCKRKDNSMFPALLSGFLLRNSDGQLVAAGILRDLSEQKQMEAERETMQQQIIAAQRNALRELSTPLIPITDEVVIMPLIGTIDSQRAQQVMEALLEGVAQHQADLVILDITGVSVVDTQVAQSFIQAAHAVRLLGAQVMLTGIQPQIAQTLVHLGVDLSGIQTQGSLQAGIAAALTKRQDA
jgi:rsbT co-antagonist protein RsbR